MTTQQEFDIYQLAISEQAQVLALNEPKLQQELNQLLAQVADAELAQQIRRLVLQLTAA